jgi:hypothetical protein
MYIIVTLLHAYSIWRCNAALVIGHWLIMRLRTIKGWGMCPPAQSAEVLAYLYPTSVKKNGFKLCIY